MKRQNTNQMINFHRYQATFGLDLNANKGKTITDRSNVIRAEVKEYLF